MHDKTAAQICAGWKAEAAQLRKEAGNWASTAAKLKRARADQLDECAGQLSRELHTSGV
jgi:hypothetical protein